MLAEILALAKDVVFLIGGGLIAWGAVRFGLSLKDRDGGTMAEAIATVGGGAVVMAAAAFFASLPTGGLG